MKKLLLIIAAILSITLAHAQSYSEKFEQYTKEQKYIVDEGNLVVSRIVEGIPGSKDDIYTTIKTYFARAYNDSKSVIQTDDKEKGVIIGKGLYGNLASFSLGVWTLKAYHIIRVDIKEGRARIICSASTIIPNSSAHIGDEGEYRIVEYAPFTNDRAYWTTKSAQLKGVVNLIDRMIGSVDSLEKALKEGGVLKTEDEDW